MKCTRLSPFPLLAAVPLALLPVVSVFAEDFTVRALPPGLDRAASLSSFLPPMDPIAADFLGNGRLQWYMGGNVITQFPAPGTITLPAITLPQTPSATARPLTAAVCDVDRDGDPDIVRINEWNGNAFTYTLQVFLNNAAGGFTPGQRVDWVDNHPTWNEGDHGFQIVPADYNKDGAPDLAVLENYEHINQTTDPDRAHGRLIIRWNDGAGGFASTTTLQSGGFDAGCRLSTADYDRDGDADLYASAYVTFEEDPLPFFTRDEYLRSLLFTNNGTGAFTVGSNFPDRRPAKFADVNGDGWADLVGHVFGSAGSLSLNNGSGGFGTPTAAAIAGYDTSTIGDRAVFAQINPDALPEVVFSLPGSVRMANSTGTSLSTSIEIGALSAETLSVADSDGDGDQDVFVSMGGNNFAFLENRRSHGVPAVRYHGFVSRSGVTSLTSADFDRDGRDDVLAVVPGEKAIYVIPGLADGKPGAPQLKSTQLQTPHSAVAADFNRDGWMDVAYTLPSPGSVRLALNTGSAASGWTDTLAASGLSGVSLLAAGEYGTPDGEPDLFTGNAATGQIRGLYQSNGVWNGQNIFSSLSPVPQSLAVGQGSSARGHETAFLSSNAASLNLRAMHLSGGWNALGTAGGHTETVTGGQHSAKVIWASIHGNPRRQEAVYIDGTGRLTALTPAIGGIVHLGTVPGEIRDIAATDWDQDGLTDVLATTDAGLSLFHYQRSDSQWHRTDLYTAVGGFYSVTVLNLDGDTYPDAVVDHGGVLEYYLNNPMYKTTADFASVPAQIVLPATGSESLAITVPLWSAGRPASNNSLADLPHAVTDVSVYVYKAVPGPDGTWVAGDPIFDMGSYCTNVTLRAGSTAIASTDPSGIQNGHIGLTNNNPLIPTIAAGTSLAHSLLLTIPVTAAQLPAPRFFISLKSFQTATVNGNTLALLPDNVLLKNAHTILVNIVPANATPLQLWRTSNFNHWQSTGNAANDADPDGDGIPNLLEYVSSQNPNSSTGIGAGPVIGLTHNTGLNTMIADLRLLTNYDSKVKLTLQYSLNPADGWSQFSTRTGTGAWSLAPVSTTLLSGGGRTRFNFDGGNPAIFPKAFYRLKAEELP